jgi:Domain of unknown function (DUF6316)
MASHLNPNDARPTDAPRNGEQFVLHSRSDRFFRIGTHWFFHTREGFDVGPFDDKNQSQLALVYFLSHNSWPSAKQLRAYLQNPPPAAPATAAASGWLRR